MGGKPFYYIITDDIIVQVALAQIQVALFYYLFTII